MGDVALVVPVIRSLVHNHKEVEVTMVTRPHFAPFFYDIERVQVFPADVDYTYNGFFGIRDLFRALIKKDSYDVVIDLHDHLRTMMLRTFFRVFFTNVVVFDKGRKQKRAFVRKRNKITDRLPHSVERYRLAFEKAGFPFDIIPPPYFPLNETLHKDARAWLEQKGLEKKEKWIGIAPFARHATKIWPLENYGLLMDAVLQKAEAKFFLFGGGKREIKYFESLQRKFGEKCVIAAGELKIRQEIALMKNLDVMLSVDSANMHLAALAGIPVVSIWGGTHPDVGFAPFGKDTSIIQVSTKDLPCRPCSVYGRESCYVGGFPCLTRITPELIAGRLVQKLTEEGTLPGPR